eukprot:1157694-Pelagomonas_calceolata.AAC.23
MMTRTCEHIARYASSDSFLVMLVGENEDQWVEVLSLGAQAPQPDAALAEAAPGWVVAVSKCLLW